MKQEEASLTFACMPDVSIGVITLVVCSDDDIYRADVCFDYSKGIFDVDEADAILASMLDSYDNEPVVYKADGMFSRVAKVDSCNSEIDFIVEMYGRDHNPDYTVMLTAPDDKRAAFYASVCILIEGLNLYDSYDADCLADNPLSD